MASSADGESEVDLRARLAALPPEVPEYAAALNDLAVHVLSKGGLDEAQQLLERLRLIRLPDLQVEGVRPSVGKPSCDADSQPSTSHRAHQGDASAASDSWEDTADTLGADIPPTRPRGSGRPAGMGGGVAMFARALGGGAGGRVSRASPTTTRQVSGSRPLAAEGVGSGKADTGTTAPAAVSSVERPRTDASAVPESPMQAQEADTVNAAAMVSIEPVLSAPATEAAEPKRAESVSPPRASATRETPASHAAPRGPLVSGARSCVAEPSSGSRRVGGGWDDGSDGAEAAEEMTRQARAALGECTHVLEVYGLTTAVRTADLEEFVATMCPQDGRPLPVIKWVDDHHALLVCPNPATAALMLQEDQDLFALRPFLEASAASKAMLGPELLPPRERPKTTAAVAKRLLSHALGMRELRDRDAEKELATARKAAREARREREEKLAAAWDDD